MTSVALYVRGALLLGSPALYAQGGITQSPSRLGLLGLIVAWTALLALAHQQEHDITSRFWLSADILVTVAYLVLVAINDQEISLDPVVLGPVLTAAAAESRAARKAGIALTAAFATITAVADGPGATRPVVLSGAVAVAAGIVIPTVGPRWARRVSARLDAARYEVTRPSTELLSHVAAKAERADMALREDLERLAADPMPARQALALIADNHAAREETVRLLFNEARTQIAHEASIQRAHAEAAPTRAARRRRPMPGGDFAALARWVRRLRVVRQRRARGRELLPLRVVAEDLFIVALMVRLWLLIQAGSTLFPKSGGPGWEELTHPRSLNPSIRVYVVLVAWWAVLSLLWFVGHPFLLEDGWRVLVFLDLLVGVVALLSAGGESSRALLPAFAGTVLLSSTRGWRKGLTAAAVLIAALAIHSGPSVAATGGSGYAFAGEVLVLLAWGLGAGIAASAALMVAESIEKGGENRSIHSLGRVHRTLGPAKLTDVALGSTLDTERLDPADLARLLEDHEDGMRQYDAVKEGRTVVVGRRPLTVNTAIRTEIRTTVARISRRRELAIRLSRWQPLYSRRDSLLLSEVVRELLINAHIHAADGPVVLSSRLERGQWVVRVSDPGGEVRNRRRGSGFGLAYYRHAVHRLDGRLESGPGLAVLRMPFVRLWSLSGPKGDSPLSAAGLGWSQDGPDMPTRPAS